MRRFMAYFVLPFMLVTGFRFSKAYRHGEDRFRASVYRAIDTVYANILCWRITGED